MPQISNADRLVFPEDGITKGDVADYYLKVADRLLPYIADRPLTVQRFPRGVGQPGFMQKNAPEHYPEEMIRRHEMPKGVGGTTVYPVIDSAEAIVFFANLGVITFHAPPVRVEDMTQPDWVIWDLDPPESRADLAREAAIALRAVLESHEIPTLPMTSGSKGFHLRAKLQPGRDFEEVGGLARGTAALAAAAHPDLMTLAFKKSERGDRVFVDWLRNAPLSTSVAPWSLRPRRGAPVATPLAWDEVDSIEPDGIRMGDALDRTVPALWADPEALQLGAALVSVDRALSGAGIRLEPFNRFRSE